MEKNDPRSIAIRLTALEFILQDFMRQQWLDQGHSEADIIGMIDENRERMADNLDSHFEISENLAEERGQMEVTAAIDTFWSSFIVRAKAD